MGSSSRCVVALLILFGVFSLGCADADVAVPTTVAPTAPVAQNTQEEHTTADGH